MDGFSYYKIFRKGHFERDDLFLWLMELAIYRKNHLRISFD